MKRAMISSDPDHRITHGPLGVAVLGRTGPGRDQWTGSDTAVWIEGDLWSLTDHRWEERPARTLGERFEREGKADGVRTMKGFHGDFAALIHDRQQGLVHLITDPFGLQHLYWTRWSGGIAWSTGYRAFLGLRAFSPTLDETAVEDFIGVGFHTGDQTWFKEVELIPVGSILTIRIDDQSTQLRVWDDRAYVGVQPTEAGLDDYEAELRDQFRSAVADAVLLGKGRPGLTLSGGWDSRALLGAFAEVVHAPYCLTRGMLDSQDVKWAVRAARAVRAQHEVYPLGPDNWLRNRARAIWETEAMSSLLHLNAAATADRFAVHADVNLGGGGGEVLTGHTEAGTVQWLTEDRRARVDDLLGREAGQRVVERWRTWIDRMPSASVGYVLGRLRRFTSSARRIEGSWGIHTRLPYADPRFLALVLAAPGNQVEGGRLARRMHIASYPDLFGSIPSTREAPLGGSAFLRSLSTVAMKARARQGGALGRLGLPFRNRRVYQDPGRWLRIPPGRDLIDRLLLGKQARIETVLPRDKVVAQVNAQMSGRPRTESVCALLTIEIWFRQLDDPSFRTGLDGIDWW